MIALKVNLYQRQAVYRNPFTSEIIETFPLPPPSTVLGLLSALTRQQYMLGQINFGISGTFDTMIRDYQRFKKGPTLKMYSIIVHMLFDVHLTLHIMASDELLRDIEDSFMSPKNYPYLGRAEDMLKVLNVERVELKEEKMDQLNLKQSHYIPLSDMDEISTKGIFYYLPTFMVLQQIRTSKPKTIKSIRTFDWAKYHYVEKGNMEYGRRSKSKVLLDGEHPVWRVLPNQSH